MPVDAAARDCVWKNLQTMPADRQETLLGGIDAGQFLTRHWQKAPLLVRAALPRFEAPLSPEELAGLACEEGIEARLVLEHGGTRPWEVRHGPFEPADFASLPDRDWTLLVQDVDKHVPAVAALLDCFDFLPRWRLDDVMVSYAAPGGGVGPHLDSYDVFLIQAQGQRRWSIARSGYGPSDFMPGVDLRILQHFRAEETFVVAPGDLLYLPPGVAHEGVAEGPSMTCSVGFRAPSRRELYAALTEHVTAGLDLETRYADPDLTACAQPGRISADTVQRARALVDAVTVDAAAFRRWLGCYLTEPVPGLLPPPTRRRLGPAALRRRLERAHRLHWSPACRTAFMDDADPALLFVAGQAHVLEPELRFLGPMLSNAREIPIAQLRSHCDDRPEILTLLAEFHGRRCLVFE